VNNVEIILTETPASSLLMPKPLRCLGIEPRDRLLIGLKSAVHYRAGYQDLATKIFEVDTPGITTPGPDEIPLPPCAPADFPAG